LKIDLLKNNLGLNFQINLTIWNMSNLYSYFVNPKTVSYITSEYVDVNNIDSSNVETINKIQVGIKKALDDTFSKLDTSKISGGNVNDAIQKFVNVTMKRLDLQPRNRNVPAQANMRMPPQHSTNTRMINDESIDNRTNNYMKNYREFNTDSKPKELPEWLQSQNTNPKRVQDEMNKKMQPSDAFKNTSTRKMSQVFNDSEANPTQDIGDYSGNLNFSYFNDTPEITSAFDDAFYTTGIDPASTADAENESLESRLKKIEGERNSVKIVDQKVENIEELFKNDNEFKKHLNMANKKYHHSSKNDMEENVNKLSHQPNKVQQNLANQNRMNPNVLQQAEHYSQHQYTQQHQQQQQNQQQQQQQQQVEQYIQEITVKFSMKEKQYQEQLQAMHGKMTKYEEYLKTLMAKYNELRDDRDLLKERFKNTSSNESTVNKYAMDAIEEKKRELLLLSNSVQEKISKLEQLQNNNQ
jgi:hypothetical protein